MIDQVRKDSLAAPRAFSWNGPTARRSITRWLDEHRVRVPADLVLLWETTGGGDLFETEELLSPGAATDDHEIGPRNERLQKAGLPDGLLVFHVGLYLTAIRGTHEVVHLDPDSLEVRGTFESLDEWYADLRSEYARTYGLSAVPTG